MTGEPVDTHQIRLWYGGGQRRANWQAYIFGDIARMADEIDQLRKLAHVELWECPDCAFEMDARHTDADTGLHSCPVCEAARLRTALTDLLASVDEDHFCFVGTVCGNGDCAQPWPCPAERARLALAAEAQP